MPTYRRKLPRIEWGGRRTLFRYVAGDDLTLSGATFSRASEARYTDANGVIRTAASGVARDDHWIDGERTLLLERAATNLSPYSQEADNAAWTLSRATVSANADTAPDGTLTADRLIEDSTAAATHRTYSASTFTITADANVVISRYLKAGTRSWAILGVVDNSETNAARVYFDLGTGAVGASAVAGTGTVVSSGITALGNGWYHCWMVGNLGGGITAARHYLGLASGNNGASYSGDGASYLRTWGAQSVNNQSHASSYIPTTSGTATRQQDVLYWPFLAVPQEMTVYADLVNLGTSEISSGRWWQIGAGDGGNPRLIAITSGAGSTRRIQAFHNNDVDADVTSTPVAQVTVGARAEFRFVLNADGSVVGAISIDGGAEVVAAASSAPAAGLAAAWDATAPRLYLSGLGSACHAVRSVVIAAGIHELARLRGVGAGDDIFDSVLALGYPLDEAVSYPVPQDGGQMIFTPSGEADGWDAGTAHVLEGVVRWIPRETTATPVATGWDGASGWRAFLEWARRGNAFWFCPDASDLSTGWTVHLEAPFDEGPTLEPDMTRALRVRLRTTVPIEGY